MDLGENGPADGLLTSAPGINEGVSPPQISTDLLTNQSGQGNLSDGTTPGKIDFESPSDDDDEIISQLEQQAATGPDSPNVQVTPQCLVRNTRQGDSAPFALMEGILWTGPEVDSPEAERAGVRNEHMKLEVALPFIPLAIREQYEELRSNVIVKVLSLASSAGVEDGSTVELADGTKRMVCYTELRRTSASGSIRIHSLFTGTRCSHLFSVHDPTMPLAYQCPFTSLSYMPHLRMHLSSLIFNKQPSSNTFAFALTKTISLPQGSA
jgi:hypothetical protein